MQSEKKNKKILVICPHPVGYVPGQRLKYEQYFEHWKENGFELTVSPFMSESMQQIVYQKGYLFQKAFGTVAGYLKRLKDLSRVKNYDVVYLFLWATPFGPPIFEWSIRLLAKKIVYDIDDLVFLKNISHENKFLALLKGKRKPLFMMKVSDHIITCTPFLDQIARKYNRSTTDISSTINTATYLPVNNYKNDHTLILGWSGSHSTSNYLYLLQEVLTELKSCIDFKLLVMGDAGFCIPGIEIEALEWSAEREIEILQRIDIGLYPLPLDDQWVLGKSGLKALQYMALGIPTIATDIGCNNRVIEDGVSGFLVTNHRQWVDRIKDLCENELLRKKLGREGRARVEKLFSIKANQNRYLKILQDVSSASGF